MHVEVVYALPEEQERVLLDLAPGSSVGDAIATSGLIERRRILQLERIGVWGRPAGLDAKLRDGDRVEIYRPLTADPKEVRRKRAAKSVK